MMASLRAELRKLFTIRSTYVVLLLLVVFIAIGSFYVEGYNTSRGALLDSHKLVNAVLGGAASIIPQMIAIIAILLMAHEFRYNTLSYALTLTNRRSKFLAAKIITVTVFAFMVTLFSVLLTMGLTYLGLKLKGTAIPHQDLMFGTVLWRTVAYSIGYSLFGLALITLIRNLTAAILLLFAGVGVIEQLLSLVIKSKADYLPFHALGQLIQPIASPGINASGNPLAGHSFGPLEGLRIFTIYLVLLWAVSWYLFLHRDAA